MKVRPGNILVAIRDLRNLYYLNDLLANTDVTRQDIVVMTSRIYHREHAFSGSTSYDSEELFEEYEQQLFTKVVALAEKQGKHVSLMVVPSTNVFDAILQTAARLESSRIVCGLSNRLTLDEQGKLTGDAWERLPEPRPNIVLEIHAPDHTVQEYYLGPHTPRLRDQDLGLLHKIWLEVSEDPELASLHHYHIVGMALERLYERLNGPQREETLALLKKELHKPDQDD
jgi:nucleotide-binding universal stress UspA family protein